MIEIDTDSVEGEETLVVNLFYPRVEGSIDKIQIALFDVRAANDIVIKFDFERNGWSILSDLEDPEGEWEDQPRELTEVAFVDAWPIKGENDGNREQKSSSLR